MENDGPQLEQPADKWQRELREAGWREVRATIWKAPGGELFRGPYHAWQVMTKRRAEASNSR
jgi:hypothetical protein